MDEFKQEDVFDLAHYEENQEQQQEEQENPDLFQTEEGSEEQQEEEPVDYLSSFLKSKGIDRHAIQIQNEAGEIEEVDFDDLTDEEKVSVLSMGNDPVITDDEMQTINFLRQNKMSLKDYTNWQVQEGIKKFQADSQTKQYKVDMLSDEDLYKFDLMERYPDLTEDEVKEEVERAKENETLFTKKIEALKKEYKELEDNQVKYEEQMAAQEAEEQYNQLAQSLVNVARSTNDLHDLTLEDEDKEAVLSFLLDRDANGQSEFYKLFENPEALFKMAWYMKYGDQAFKAINDYYKGVIEKSRRAGGQPSTRTVRKTNRGTKTDAFDLEEQVKNLN